MSFSRAPVDAPVQTAYGAAPGDDDGAALQAATPRGSAPRTLPQHRLTQKPRTAAQTRGRPGRLSRCAPLTAASLSYDGTGRISARLGALRALIKKGADAGRGARTALRGRRPP